MTPRQACDVIAVIIYVRKLTQALATGRERVINWLVLQALPATRTLSGSGAAVPEQIDAAMFINSHHDGTVFSCRSKLQALVYDILPSTTAVFSYAIGSRKRSANEQFFVGAQTVVTLLQTTQLYQMFILINDHVAYARSDKTKIV